MSEGAVAGTHPPPAHPHVALDASVLAGVAAFHLVDHLVVDPKWHLATHSAAASATLAAGRGLGLSPSDMGIRPATVPAGLKLGGAVAGLVAIGVVGAGVVPAGRGVFADARVLRASGRRIAFWAAIEIPLGTAIYEEVLFRGVLLGLGDRRLGRPASMALTSALFGLWHVLPALADREHNPYTKHRHPVAHVLPTVVGTALAGLGFTELRRRSDSLVAPVLVHTATNAIPLLVAAAVARLPRRR